MSILRLLEIRRARDHIAATCALDDLRFHFTVWYQDLDLDALGREHGDELLDRLAFHVAMVASTRFAAAQIAAAGNPVGGGLVASAARHIPMGIMVGDLDGLLGLARSTRDELVAAGFEVNYVELPGEAHCCYIRMHASEIWSWLSPHAL